MKKVKEKGLLNLRNIKSGTWYKAILREKVFMEVDENGMKNLKPCRTEVNNPGADCTVNEVPLCYMLKRVSICSAVYIRKLQLEPIQL